MRLLWFCIVVLFSSLLGTWGLTPSDQLLKERVEENTNSSLLWGTYRPNLYFGTRPRTPDSLMTGLMWFDASHFQGFQRMRHACEQGDGLAGYGYQKHDGRAFAKQHLNDEPSNVEITTEFIKVPGGKEGGDWGVRIHGKPIHSHLPAMTSVLFYFGLEGEGSMDITSRMSSKGLASPVKLEGDTPDLGDFEVEVIDGLLNDHPRQGLDQDLTKTQWVGLQVPEGNVWRAKEVLHEHMMQSARKKVQPGQEDDLFSHPHMYFTLENRLVEENDEIANLYAFQKVFNGEFQFDVIYRSTASNDAKLTSETLGEWLSVKEKDFDARFDATFGLKEKGFSQEQVQFGQSLLSNLVGGLGYFHGASVVDRSHPPMQDEESFAGEPIRAQLTSPQSLFTATPSRSFFPRGFYWDEGFHQMLLGNWDNDLSLNVIKSWVNAIDENGWVAREQILGDEARSKVPAEFQTQFPHYANPPTLYLAIKQYVDRLTSKHQTGKKQMAGLPINGQQVAMDLTLDDPHMTSMYLDHLALGQDWLNSVYPHLRRNWQWFRQTQRGHQDSFGRSPANNEAYRWRGRTPDHCLTSGLDDYPRGEPPNVGELHADLMSWMAFATQLLKDIATAIDVDGSLQQDIDEYTHIKKDMLANLDALHWSDVHQAYCDQTLNDEGYGVHVCHKGYLSLLPMALGLLPAESPKLGAILDMIENDEELWSPYGLRSLSKSDPFYNTGEVYWRGPIWININYLTLQGLYNNYLRTPGPYQEQAQTIYTQLRENLINNVYSGYKNTGYVFEQYNDNTGKGQRIHPFTGWTTLILLIMAEKY
ncbi:glycoside hydrolase [Hesseltinella vesiculosa]|uniref:Mannosyl-oligosaccharide glucosidase n=1 Tax=Hesseltinella vesiculosa TaxID=101127 RepID=A0A1X2GHB0_9FUNG|nr:glycoside hydrolase [Hesseltinella vesiculosa]